MYVCMFAMLQSGNTPLGLAAIMNKGAIVKIMVDDHKVDTSHCDQVAT